MQINSVNLQTKGGPYGENNPQYLILHHADMDGSVEDINRVHLNKGFWTIGYSYYVRKDGSIWRGRPENCTQANCYDYNSNSVSICAEGNFMTDAMSEAQKNSIIELGRWIESRYGNKLQVKGHRELYATDCPGKNYPLDEIRSAIASGGVSSALTQLAQQAEESHGFTPNAVVVGDDLFARKWDGSRELGHQANIGDKIFVKDVSFSRQLALILYPVSGGYREAYVTNCSCIRYLHPGNWKNGHTIEYVYDTPGGHIIGSLDPWEIATILYVQNGWTAVVYNTGKGQNTKSGFVKFAGL